MTTPSAKINQTQKLIDEILAIYPEKTRIDRAKHVKPNDPTATARAARSSPTSSRARAS